MADDGLLSQDDIDAAIAASAQATTDAEAATAGDGILSQADIDAALAEAGASPASEPTAESAPAPAPAPEPDGGLLSQADIDAALAEATQAQEAGQAAAPPTPVVEPAPAPALAPAPSEPSPLPAGAEPLDLPDFAGSASQQPETTAAIDLLGDVDLTVEIELGRTRMRVADVLRLTSGAVVELDKLAGDPVDVLVNNRLVARGEVLVLNDTFCVRVNEILASPVRAAG